MAELQLPTKVNFTPEGKARCCFASPKNYECPRLAAFYIEGQSPEIEGYTLSCDTHLAAMLEGQKNSHQPGTPWKVWLMDDTGFVKDPPAGADSQTCDSVPVTSSPRTPCGEIPLGEGILANADPLMRASFYAFAELLASPGVLNPMYHCQVIMQMGRLVQWLAQCEKLVRHDFEVQVNYKKEAEEKARVLTEELLREQTKTDNLLGALRMGMLPQDTQRVSTYPASAQPNGSPPPACALSATQLAVVAAAVEYLWATVEGLVARLTPSTNSCVPLPTLTPLREAAAQRYEAVQRALGLLTTEPLPPQDPAVAEAASQHRAHVRACTHC